MVRFRLAIVGFDDDRFPFTKGQKDFGHRALCARIKPAGKMQAKKIHCLGEVPADNHPSRWLYAIAPKARPRP